MAKMTLTEARGASSIDQASLEAAVAAVTNAIGANADLWVSADREKISVHGSHDQWNSVVAVKSRDGDNFHFSAWGSVTDRFGEWYHEDSGEGDSGFMASTAAWVVDCAG